MQLIYDFNNKKEVVKKCLQPKEEPTLVLIAWKLTGQRGAFFKVLERKIG